MKRLRLTCIEFAWYILENNEASRFAGDDQLASVDIHSVNNDLVFRSPPNYLLFTKVDHADQTAARRYLHLQRLV